MSPLRFQTSTNTIPPEHSVLHPAGFHRHSAAPNTADASHTPQQQPRRQIPPGLCNHTTYRSYRTYMTYRTHKSCTNHQVPRPAHLVFIRPVRRSKTHHPLRFIRENPCSSVAKKNTPVSVHPRRPARPSSARSSCVHSSGSRFKNPSPTCDLSVKIRVHPWRKKHPCRCSSAAKKTPLSVFIRGPKNPLSPQTTQSLCFTL
jgi:hypothetical protein